MELTVSEVLKSSLCEEKQCRVSRSIEKHRLGSAPRKSEHIKCNEENAERASFEDLDADAAFSK